MRINKMVDAALGAHAPAVVVAVVVVVMVVSGSVVLLFVEVVTSAAVVSMSIGSTVVTVSLPAENKIEMFPLNQIELN